MNTLNLLLQVGSDLIGRLPPLANISERFPIRRRPRERRLEIG